MTINPSTHTFGANERVVLLTALASYLHTNQRNIARIKSAPWTLQNKPTAQDRLAAAERNVARAEDLIAELSKSEG